MRKPFVAGNWKMHGSREQTAALLSGILAGAADNAAEIAVFPPFTYLAQASDALTGTPLAWGAQNVSEHEAGAYTGEVAASMLLELGCQYVLVGHSERRSIFGETNEQVAAKFIAAESAGLKPILCVGETLEQREADQTESVVSGQIEALLALANGVKALYNGLIAYEPVWAIGTGKTATPQQAQSVHQAIRGLVAKHDEALAKSLRVLYGGSVKRDNAKELFAMPDIDGGLIGGASLDAEHFLEIVRSCNN